MDGNDFKLITTIKRPSLPLRCNFTQWGVEWTDPDYNLLETKYKIIALDSNGNEL